VMGLTDGWQIRFSMAGGPEHMLFCSRLYLASAVILCNVDAPTTWYCCGCC
jgi:hypothetical protein